MLHGGPLSFVSGVTNLMSIFVAQYLTNSMSETGVTLINSLEETDI